jgi:hypothetical protein
MRCPKDDRNRRATVLKVDNWANSQPLAIYKTKTSDKTLHMVLTFDNYALNVYILETLLSLELSSLWLKPYIKPIELGENADTTCWNGQSCYIYIYIYKGVIWCNIV